MNTVLKRMGRYLHFDVSYHFSSHNIQKPDTHFIGRKLYICI